METQKSRYNSYPVQWVLKSQPNGFSRAAVASELLPCIIVRTRNQSCVAGKHLTGAVGINGLERPFFHFYLFFFIYTKHTHNVRTYYVQSVCTR